MDKPLRIITADERFAEKSGAKLTLLGKSGIGKTSQLRTLPEASTLFVDLEAGDLAVKAWRGDCVRPATWPEFRDLVVFLAGPNPALPPDAPFSEAHYRHVCDGYGDPERLAKYDTYFVDSITVLSRLCLTWAKTQPQAISDRTGKPDTRGAYGLLGTEMIAALTHLQHARDKNVIRSSGPWPCAVWLAALLLWPAERPGTSRPRDVAKSRSAQTNRFHTREPTHEVGFAFLEDENMDSNQTERRKMVTIPQEEFEAILERAAERGARHALADVGLDGPEAAHDRSCADGFMQGAGFCKD